jgi:ring-1,2-phenylacetyl-CoA epoxidase subunit PaaC
MKSNICECGAMTSIVVSQDPLVRYCLGLADDALILGHRLSEWCGQAPMLEEDLAIANVSLDLIGQARILYDYAAKHEDVGYDEDDYAFLRDVSDFRNLLLVEQPNGDFAITILRQFLYSAFAKLMWSVMMASRDAALAALAAKAVKETEYHLRHSAEWVIRLGDGTQESHSRITSALEELWPYTGEMFETDEPTRVLILEGIAACPQSLHENWNDTVSGVLSEATLRRPVDGWMQSGGRRGRHSEHLGHLLAQMQNLQRTYPGVRW